MHETSKGNQYSWANNTDFSHLYAYACWETNLTFVSCQTETYFRINMEISRLYDNIRKYLSYIHTYAWK